MEYSFVEKTEASILCILIFFGMVILFFAGRTIRLHFKKTEDDLQKSSEPLQTSVFALFGFILAFAFGMSGNRYESIRNVLLDEANDIGTAILRSDLYSDSIRKQFRTDFSDYLEARILLYSNILDTSLISQSKKRGEEEGKRLWGLAMSESKKANMLIPSNSMIPALNNMFDIATKREEMLRTSVPDPIIYMLFIMALVSSFIAGLVYSMIRPRDWIIIISYFLFSSLVIYITLDLGRPMRGLITASRGEHAIMALRELLKN